MPAETSDRPGNRNYGYTSLPLKINDFDENVSPSDLVEPENALPAITLAELPEVTQEAAASCWLDKS